MQKPILKQNNAVLNTRLILATKTIQKSILKQNNARIKPNQVLETGTMQKIST